MLSVDHVVSALAASLAFVCSFQPLDLSSNPFLPFQTDPDAATMSTKRKAEEDPAALKKNKKTEDEVDAEEEEHLEEEEDLGEEEEVVDEEEEEDLGN